MKCLLPVIFGIIIFIPAMCAGLPVGDPGSITHNDEIILNISTPIVGEMFWIDVVPPHIMVVGNTSVPRGIKSIRVKSDTGSTDCGNQTAFFCEVPVSPGNSTIAVIVTDVSGKMTAETRNITVHIGLPPPDTISLWGKITDPQERLLANVSVRAESSLTLDNKPFVVYAQTGSDGTYLIKGALGYRQKISADKEGYESFVKEIVFENETNELDFELGPRSIFSPGFDIPLCLTALFSVLCIVYCRRRTG